jgi:type I restriction enzyme S subunit
MKGDRQTVPADQFCSSVRDGTHDSPTPVDYGRLLVTSRHITGGHLDLASAYLISQEDFDAINRRSKVDRWDVLLSMIGTVGEPCLMKAAPNFAIKNIGLFKSKGEVEGKWLYYYLRSPAAQQLIREHARGTTQQYIPLATLRAFPIVVPMDRGEMRAIAHILGTLDDKIELNRRMSETLEAMARALFKSWFVDFDPVRAKAEGRDPGLPKPLADLFPPRLVDSELGEIPEEWDVGSLAALGDLTIGGDWGEDEAFVGAVEAICLRGVDLEHLRSRGHASAPRRWFKPTSLKRRAMDDRDVLVAGSGAGPTGRPLWMCTSLLQSLGPCVYSNFCKRIRCGSAAKAVYLDSWLHDMRDSGEIWEYVNGTSVPNLDAHSLLAAKQVPMPPRPILDQYHDVVRPIWQQRYAGEAETLAALRDTLLPKLISGELRVSTAERAMESAL